MANRDNYCINCGDDLCCLDDDPNGEKNCVCARCRAVEDHDFDVEPDVTFDRAGHAHYPDEKSVKDVVPVLAVREIGKNIEKENEQWQSTT